MRPSAAPHVPVRGSGNAEPSALAIYLNDHFAGSTAGAELARRMARTHRTSRHGGRLQRLAADVAQDRDSLQILMGDLGIPVRRYKVLAGWAAEKLGRVKPNGRVVHRSGLSTVLELEALRLGVEGKKLLWQSLAAVADQDPRLDADRLRELRERAMSQIDVLESLRPEAVMAVLGTRTPVTASAR
jgi:hypothetical protein